jgi:hypothetical protein
MIDFSTIQKRHRTVHEPEWSPAYVNEIKQIRWPNTSLTAANKLTNIRLAVLDATGLLQHEYYTHTTKQTPPDEALLIQTARKAFGILCNEAFGAFACYHLTLQLYYPHRGVRRESLRIMRETPNKAVIKKAIERYRYYAEGKNLDEWKKKING